MTSLRKRNTLGIISPDRNYQRLVIVDKDDSVMPDVPYSVDPDDINIYPDVVEAFHRLRENGFGVVVATNQSVISRESVDEKTYHRYVLNFINEAAGNLDGYYFCPHHPDDGCECRKPGPGLIERVLEDYQVDSGDVYMVGDSVSDLEAAERAGVPTVQTFQVDYGSGYRVGDVVGHILYREDELHG